MSEERCGLSSREFRIHNRTIGLVWRFFECLVTNSASVHEGPGCQPRLPKIISTYGRKRFSHIEVGMGSGVPRLTRMPGRNKQS